MKKLISLTLAIMLVMSLAVPALALDKDNTTGTADVTYSSNAGYTVTIPSEIAMTLDATTRTLSGTGDVALKAGMLINADETLKVTVSPANSDTAFELVSEDDSTDKIAYTIGTADDTDAYSGGGAIISETTYNASDITKTLTFVSTDTVDQSGKYADTVTFTITVS